jgi:glycosyltransferase involved in cell wall biosynthesis
MAPFFSVVMPSYLGHYEGLFGAAAANRVEKFHRAIESVIAQNFDDWELVVVADGCEETWNQKERYLDSEASIRFFRIAKQRLWSPHVRNFGLSRARGQYAIYLDTDDVYEPDYLRAVHRSLSLVGMPKWAALDDLVWDGQRWVRRLVSHLLAKGTAGTSNVVHRVGLAYWPAIEYRHPGYGYATEDSSFVKELGRIAEPVSIPAAGYRVMHIPRQYDL